MNPALLPHPAEAEKTFAAGEVIIEQGGHNETFFVVLEGEVEIHLDGEVVEKLGEGGVFGEMALVDPGPSPVTILARTEARLSAVDRPHFLFLVQEHPTFALHLMGVMAERLRRMDEKFEG